MKNKNRKKSIIIAIVVVVLCLAGYKIADKVSYPLVRAKAVLYLADKYNAKISDFEMTDYNHSNFFWSDKLIFIPVLKMTDFSFEFKYKDRSFIVTRYNGHFYDDFQLPDVEHWCTQWLIQNVDNRIVGVTLSSLDLYWYQSYNNKGAKYIITQDDTVEFLNCYSFNRYGKKNCAFGFYDSNISENDNQATKNVGNEIVSKLHSKLNINDEAYCTYENSEHKFSISKEKNQVWKQQYFADTALIK